MNSTKTDTTLLVLVTSIVVFHPQMDSGRFFTAATVFYIAAGVAIYGGSWFVDSRFEKGGLAGGLLLLVIPAGYAAWIGASDRGLLAILSFMWSAYLAETVVTDD